MIKIFKILAVLLFASVFLATVAHAQSPAGFNYQGVALTSTGTPVLTKKISLRLSLLEGSATGTVRYQELQGVNTDAYGQFSVVVGSGQPVTGKFSDVQWSKFAYYLKSEIDIDGATNFINVGTSQLMSVPYALYANTSGAASVNVDSILNELKSIKLVQKGDSILLNNNRGAVFVSKLDSLSKIAAQVASLKTQYESTSDSALKTINSRYDSLAKVITSLNASPSISSSSGPTTLKYVAKGLDTDLMPSVYFDGEKTNIVIGPYAVLGTKIVDRSFTVEGWVKSLKKSDTVQIIFASGNNGWKGWNASNFRVFLEKGKLLARVGGYYAGYNLFTDFPDDNSWHHFAFTHDEKGPSAKLFLDGVEKIRSGAMKWSTIDRGGITVEGIGANLSDGSGPAYENFKGNIRKIRVSKGLVYTTDFSPSTKYGKADSTIALWELNEGSGTTIKCSDSTYNATLYNGIWNTNDTNTVNNVVDVEGNVYKTVKIGTQVWMAENLKTTKYRDGSKIQKVTDNTSWNNLSSGAYSDYGNDSTLGTVYGKLYNYYTITNSQKVCPSGWHVPTMDEFKTLESYLGKDSAGFQMKTTVGWTWDRNGNNKSGFSGLPGGARESGNFVAIYALGYWWSSTESLTTSAQIITLTRENNLMEKYVRSKTDGYSIRCIKD